MKKRVNKVTLPLGQVPKGRGWSIQTGNLEVNLWVRKPRPHRERSKPLERNPFYDNVQWVRS